MKMDEPVIRYIWQDLVGMSLSLGSLYFLLRGTTLAENQNYVAGILSIIGGLVVLVLGLRLLRISVAAKASEIPKPEGPLGEGETRQAESSGPSSTDAD